LKYFFQNPAPEKINAENQQAPKDIIKINTERITLLATLIILLFWGNGLKIILEIKLRIKVHPQITNNQMQQFIIDQ